MHTLHIHTRSACESRLPQRGGYTNPSLQSLFLSHICNARLHTTYIHHCCTYPHLSSIAGFLILYINTLLLNNKTSLTYFFSLLVCVDSSFSLFKHYDPNLILDGYLWALVAVMAQRHVIQCSSTCATCGEH